MWIYLAICSALFLGIYDICKKWSLKDNFVLQVLFLSNCFALSLTVPVLIASIIAPAHMKSINLYCEFLSFKEHGYIFGKTLLVSTSWISAFFALKHLPISIVTPIRASAPLWTLLGAVLLFGEHLQWLHWLAFIIVFSSYFAFSVLGKKEGIHFTKNKWVLLIFVATLTGALSALYDKYLLQYANIPPVTLQVWFSLYLVLVNGIIFFAFKASSKKSTFHFRYSIVFIGLFLIIADYLYFRALSQKDALVAIISITRRSSVVVSFVLGGIIFKEKNKRKKLIPLVGVLIGIGLLTLATLRS